MHIVVIAGGESSEREVSLRSGAAVAEALQQASHTVDTLDPAVHALDQTLTQKYDVAFPIIHGTGGEDGTLQRQLENIGLAYVGTGVAASELCFDKAAYREFVQAHGIPIAQGMLVDTDSLWQSPLVQQPFVLKPVNGGSSIDTFIVRNPSEMPRAAITEAFGRHQQLLLEQLIEGVEITVGVLGNQALPVIEIIPPPSGEFDYENKYNGTTQELCPPQHVAETTQQQAQDLAAKVHQLCGCLGFSRTDMIVTADNQLVVLETNTLPGMTNESLFPKAAKVAGMGMPELCDQLVQLALTHRTDVA